MKYYFIEFEIALKIDKEMKYKVITGIYKGKNPQDAFERAKKKIGDFNGVKLLNIKKL